MRRAYLLGPISDSYRADGNCAGDPQPLWVARAFSPLSTLWQQLLQHAHNVSANLPVRHAGAFASLGPFFTRHGHCLSFDGNKFAQSAAAVTFSRNMNIYRTRA